MEIGYRISTLRKERGFTQEMLGDKLGVSRQTISKWESGAAKPEIDKIIAMSKLFGVPTDSLLIGETNPCGSDIKNEMEKATTEDSAVQYPKIKRHVKRALVAGIIMVVIGLAGILGVVMIHMFSADAGDVTVFYTTSYISRNTLLWVMGTILGVGIGFLIYWFSSGRRRNGK